MSASRLPAPLRLLLRPGSPLRRRLPDASRLSFVRRCLAATLHDIEFYDGFPSFNVAIYGGRLDVATLFRAVHEHQLVATEVSNHQPTLAQYVKESHVPEHVNSVVLEGMRATLFETESYRTLRSDIATEYGVPGNTVFNVGFELRGRSEKHLVITHFQGHTLQRLAFDRVIDPAVANDAVVGFSADDAINFAAMVAQWRQSFSPDALLAEYQYVAASTVAHHLQHYYDEHHRASNLAHWARHHTAASPSLRW